MAEEVQASDSEIESYLRHQWLALVEDIISNSSSTPSSFDPEKWWNRIRDHYNDGHRYYHTLKHIRSMFSLYEKFTSPLPSSGANDPKCGSSLRFHKHEIVKLAIFFHDVIYDPQAKDNEDKSANLFKEFAQEAQMDCKDIELVVAYIMETKYHFARRDKINNTDIDTDRDLFLDCDLAILGADPSEYRIYTENIRKEYSCYPDEIFLPNRAKFLESMLKILSSPDGNAHIFRTEPMRELYEQQAITNMQHELMQLRQDDKDFKE